MAACCFRCNHWSCGVQVAGGECSICKELHKRVQLLVSGAVSLSLEQAVLAQLRGLYASVQALGHSSAGISVVVSWLDKAPKPIRTSPPRESGPAASGSASQLPLTSLNLPLRVRQAAASTAPIVLAPRSVCALAVGTDGWRLYRAWTKRPPKNRGVD